MLLQYYNLTYAPNSLYQEVPCAEDEIQSVSLDPAHPWRFFSPGYPSSRGYPHNAACSWKFKVDPKKVEKVSVICDHINIVGNFFNDCDGGDFLRSVDINVFELYYIF